MNICIPISKYSSDNIIFDETVQNFIPSKGMFCRLKYSTEFTQLHTIFIDLDGMDPDDNYSCIVDIEATLLSQYAVHSKSAGIKTPDHKLRPETIDMFMRQVSDPLKIIMTLKIIGMWESDTSYGVIFKFIQTPRLPSDAESPA